jgi:hypothetical protein
MRYSSRLSITCSLLMLSSSGLAAQRVDTVVVGSASLRSARLDPGIDTVDSYVVAGSQRTPTSTTIRTITSRQESGEQRYIIRTLHWAPRGDTGVSVMTLRGDYSVVQHRVKGLRDSAAITASRSHLTGWVVLPDQPIMLIDRDIDHPVFPVEGQIPWLFPLLPLAPGYRAVVARFSQWDNKEVWSELAVIASENVELKGRTFDCWKVDTGALGPPGYRMFRWIDRRTRRVIQSVLRGADGQPEYWSYLRV